MDSTWAVLGVGVPALYTRFAGRAHQAAFEIQTQESGPGRSCRFRVFGEPFREGGLQDYYCASGAEFADLPEGQAPALVHWRQSWFGRHIDRIDPVESPDAP
jgi:hypothetical protein